MKTPRTDERATWIGKPERDGAEVVMAGFARQLETELAEARAEINKGNEICLEVMKQRDDATKMVDRLYDELTNLKGNKQ
jgi:hypothetical protein